VRRSLNVGLAMGLLSGATFGTSGSFAASLIASGWTPAAAVTARVVLAALMLTVPALLYVRARHATWASVRAIGLYGVIAVAGAQLCFFNAVSHLSVGVALLLEYSGILLVVGWEWLRHGNRPARLTVVGGAVTVAGLVLILDLAGSHRVDAVGVLWGLGAAVGLATYFVLSAERDGSVPPLVMAWGGLVVGGTVLGVIGLSGLLPLHVSFRAVTLLGRQVPWILPVLGLALIAAVIAYVAGIAAVRILGSRLASFVGLTEVLFAVVFAWLLLGQRLDPTQLAGGALVVAGIALVRLDEIEAPEARRAATPSSEAELLSQGVARTGA
jgi:drug/metabolite transporter (DMT)-like permease